MGNRGKSWHSALMQGLQTLTWFTALMMIIVVIYNGTNGYNVLEYIYLLAPIFIIGVLLTFKHSYEQFKLVGSRLIKIKLKKSKQ